MPPIDPINFNSIPYNGQSKKEITLLRDAKRYGDLLEGKHSHIALVSMTMDDVNRFANEARELGKKLGIPLEETEEKIKAAIALRDATKHLDSKNETQLESSDPALIDKIFSKLDDDKFSTDFLFLVSTNNDEEILKLDKDSDNELSEYIKNSFKPIPSKDYYKKAFIVESTYGKKNYSNEIFPSTTEKYIITESTQGYPKHFSAWGDSENKIKDPLQIKLTVAKDNPEELAKIKAELAKQLGEVNPLLQEVFEKAFDFHLKANAPVQINVILSYCKLLAKYKLPDATLRNYIKAISADGYIKTPKDSFKLLREIAAHALRFAMFTTTDSKVHEEAKIQFQNITQCDNPPYSLTDGHGGVNPDAQRVTDQVREIQKRLVLIHHGSSSLMFEARRPPTDEEPLLSRFGADVAHKVRRINAKDPNSFPGRGILISGIDPYRAFGQDPITDTKGDPFAVYKEAWPFYADDFDDLSRTHLLLTRGLIAVSSPGNEKHVINGIHYSLVVFNDHFHNKGVDVAMLVPTEVLQEKLSGTTVPTDELVKGHESEYADINDANLTPEGLIEASLEKGLECLNVGCGSNLAGGFSNSRRPNSKPLHEREPLLRGKDGVMTDLWGHVHKGDLLGHYTSKMTPELEALLIPHRKDHDDIYRVTNSLLNLLDLSELAYARHSKGFTSEGKEVDEDILDDSELAYSGGSQETEEDPDWWKKDVEPGYESWDTEAPIEDSPDKEVLEKEDDDSDFWKRNAKPGYESWIEDDPLTSKERGVSGPIEFGELSEISKNQKIFRRLEEAYKWHFGGHKKGITNKTFYPVLALTPPGDFFSPPQRVLLLDTYDMTLTIGDKKIPLSKDENWDEDMVTVQAWTDLVLPLLQDESAFRFYDRRDLGLD